MISLITTYIYQPFFNILVIIYWALSQVTTHPDMGIAVIIFSVIVRIIMLPINLAGERSADDKKAISDAIKAVRKQYAHNPVKLKKAEKQIMRSNPGAIISEFITIGVQFIIILILYRIFTTGLKGADFHLLYSFVPKVPLHLNLVFLDRFDLTRPNFTLNIIQSSLIFLFESLNMLFSPYPVTRHEFISMSIVLPVVSFMIFALLPAGKKLFIITSLVFSIFLLLVKQLYFWYHIYLVPSPRKEASDQSN